MRDRFRTQIRDEVKAAALRQLAAGGPQALSINAIAKELGVSGPALYRYFAGRDELLTELIVDAYADLAAALASGASFAVAYREWALAQPHRYRLLFAAPLPGYDAHGDRLVAAAQEPMNLLIRALPPGPPPPPALSAQLSAWASRRGVPDADPAVAARAVELWSRVHGLVSLEIEGNFASMGLDPAPLYDALSG
ncbi:TetR/AcrR family transcriptional regulator [Dactylosporangium sp. NBC_01737]|uniref:TetR/AcrR family transcriptional regulator n=1 Tax=Dactylosporangium sp. NBC_01737 TaxID=2975959 RepID=UPI002E124306|nr:TetR/AcrR family transcriptional regulator [Dactylosporangium sp. NBC_01737]